MKVLIIEDDYFLRETLVRLLCSKLSIPVIGIGTSEKAAIQMACSDLKIPVIDINGIEKPGFQEKNINEILNNLFLLEPPRIPILEIPIFLEESEEKKKLFPDAFFKLVNGVRQFKTVRIRSPCNMGIFYPQMRVWYCV